MNGGTPNQVREFVELDYLWESYGWDTPAASLCSGAILSPMPYNMSRIDYFTVAIVGICIVAIVFLVYRMSDLFRADEVATATAQKTQEQQVELEDDGLFVYMEDGTIDSVPVGAGGATDETTQPDETPQPNPAPAETPVPSDPPSDDSSVSPNPGSGDKAFTEGDFMVFAGTFRQRNLAERRLDKLHALGYKQARMEVFDRGRFAVIIVDQYHRRDSADTLVRRLASDDIRSYVKVRER
jgi:cell division septation protein DedD